MTTRDFVLLFLELAALLAVALVCGQVARRLRLPGVLGELVGGILLGPTVLGALAPRLHANLFPETGDIAVARQAIIALGMLFFLFAAGLEVKLFELRRHQRSILWTSLLGIAAPLGLGVGLVAGLPGLWGPAAAATPRAFALFVGTALSISALPVITRVLMDLDLMYHKVGVVVMAAATLNDLAGWVLFAAILGSMSPHDESGISPLLTLVLLLGSVALIVGTGRLVGLRAVRWMQNHLPWPSGLIGVTALVVLGAAAAMEGLGVHATFGAFMVGVALSPGPNGDDPGWRRAHDVIHQFAISFFAPIYFASVGLQADFADNFDPLLVTTVLAVACAGKIGGAALGGWLGGMPLREALAVGFGLNARGAIEIILASVALENNLINGRIFVALVTMALVTSLLSGPAIQRLLRPHWKPMM